MNEDEDVDKVWKMMEDSTGPVELDADSRMLGITLYSIRKSLIDGGFTYKEAQSMIHSVFVEIIVAGISSSGDEDE